MIKKALHYLIVGLAAFCALAAAGFLLYALAELFVIAPVVLLVIVGVGSILYVSVYIDKKGTLKYE